MSRGVFFLFYRPIRMSNGGLRASPASIPIVVLYAPGPTAVSVELRGTFRSYPNDRAAF